MEFIKSTKDFIVAGLWKGDLSAHPAWQRGLYRYLRLVFAAAYEFGEGVLSLRATGLVYSTLLSLIPLLAVIFSVLKSFGIHNRLEPFLLPLVTPLGARGPELVERILSFVDNLRVGMLGTVGVLTLFLSIVFLIEKVEDAFNHIWRIRKPRSMIRKVSDYLSVVIIGPFLLIFSIGIFASLKSTYVVQELLAMEQMGRLMSMVTRLMPYLSVSLAFTFFYVFIPNTTVRFRSAFAGGLVGGVLWLIAGWTFTSFVASSSRYDIIYSGFAVLVLFLLWLYVAWTITLVGAEVAFLHQNPEACIKYAPRDFDAPLEKEYIVLALMREVGLRFSQGLEPLTSLELSRLLGVPEWEVRAIIDRLIAAGLVHEFEKDPVQVLPSAPPDRIRVKSILDAVRVPGNTVETYLAENRNYQGFLVPDILRKIDCSLEKTLDGMTLHDLAGGEDPPAPPSSSCTD